MIQDSNNIDVDYTGFDVGTGDTIAIIIVGSCDCGTAIHAYLGVQVTLIDINDVPEPEEKPFLLSIRYMGIPAWPELYGDAPHCVPNHYSPAPPKIQYNSTVPYKTKITIKQPVSKAGFKRGQRR